MLPEPGQIVRVRYRQYLVEDVIPGGPAEPAFCDRPLLTVPPVPGLTW